MLTEGYQPNSPEAPVGYETKLGGIDNRQIFEQPPVPENEADRTYPIDGVVTNISTDRTSVSIDTFGLLPALSRKFSRPSYEGVVKVDVEVLPEEVADLSEGSKIQLGVHLIDGRLVTSAALNALKEDLEKRVA